MSSALLDAPRFALQPSGPPMMGRGRPTLEDLLAGTLQAARTPEGARCPICSGAMHADNGAARCDGCGSTLS